MTHTWVLLSLISAFTLATSDAFTKKALAKGNEYLVGLFRLLFSLPFLLCLLFFVPAPRLDREFYIAFAFALPLEIAAWVFYIRALKISPLSLTLPFLSLTPVFLIVVSYAILGERVSLQGGIGILCLAAGSYVLHFHKMEKGILEPFRAIIKEKGSVLMIFAAFIYSITSSLGKMAIIHSSPLFFGIVYFIVVTVVFAPIALWMGRHELKGFISEQTIQGTDVSGTMPCRNGRFPYGCHKSDTGCLYDFPEKDKRIIGCCLRIFFVQRKTYERETHRSFIDVHRFYTDCNGSISFII